ncbi:uncharacterized protein LOC111008302 [Momordica charantia]|uniref:Uncharacterized protein LOC111008302 n=1 Tax=Momordica charantia TaxID=3673 RepID=A0A6J1C617_MOMCH|nr:uncharacterized protein LOC111008302 [Momordica charantia]
MAWARDGTLEFEADLPRRESAAPTEELELVPLLSPEKQVSIGTKLGATDREELIHFLRSNSDVFAWSHEDMPSIDPKIMTHRLSIDPSFRPVKQKRRPINKERSDVIVEEFEPRTALKGQAATDFIAELTPPSELSEADLPWTIYVDGSSNEKGCGAGVLLLGPGGERFEYALRFGFRTSNNEAEYEAFIAGLRIARALGASCVKVFSDSQLVVSQIKEEYQAKDSRMEKYLGKVRSHLAQFRTYEVSRVPRAENSNADALAKLASAYETNLARSVPVEILDNPSISEPDLMEIGAPESSWMDPIADFIRGNSPQDPKERRKLARRAARFVVRGEALYRRGFSLPLLRCLTPEEGLYVLREIHEGVCGNHSGARSLSAKVIRQGYYWPTLSQDVKKFVRTCDNCQRYGTIIHQPPELLTPISAPWPFAQWGVDIIGPFPLGRGQTKFAVVAVDYFTKWAEAEALSHITESRVTSFVWTNVICRFGIPQATVTDNGKQFDNAKFKDFCSKLGISHLSSSPAHPQANGQLSYVKTSLSGPTDASKTIPIEKLVNNGLNGLIGYCRDDFYRDPDKE